MSIQQFKELVDKVVNETAALEDYRALAKYINDDKNGALAEYIHGQLAVKDDHSFDEDKWKLVAEKIVSADRMHDTPNTYPRPIVHRVHFLKTAWFRYAAAILLILGVAGYIFVAKQPTEKPVIIAEQNKEPGTDRATLTLSDGRQVILENANNQSISDGNISIGNTNGILSYSAVPASETNSIGINTTTTPRGGQYQLVLPDGSRVWLNSASSLKYPVVFSGKQRMVELSGEAYFEIKGNKKVPFKVKTERGEVLVLGTEFNINSYSDEPSFSTTLVSGSVKVSTGKDVKTILPGQQAQLSNSQPNILKINNDVDINRVIAWQKGMFEFKGVDLDVLARQLSRWYDVKIIVANNNKTKKLSGGIAKKTPLKGLLKMLEVNGVSHNWDNNIITLYIN